MAFASINTQKLACHLTKKKTSQPIYIYIYIYICVCVWVCGLSERNRYVYFYVKGLCSPVAQETRVQTVVESYQRFKMVLDASLLNTLRYGSRVNGAIHGKELRPPLNHGVVAIEKRAFRSPSTTLGLIDR